MASKFSQSTLKKVSEFAESDFSNKFAMKKTKFEHSHALGQSIECTQSSVQVMTHQINHQSLIHSSEDCNFLIKSFFKVSDKVSKTSLCDPADL